MHLSRDQFDVLVREVETRYSQNPSALRGRIAFLTALGYVGLIAATLGAVALSALFLISMLYVDSPGVRAFLASMAGIVLLAGGWGTLRALLVRFPPPEGRKITRAESPALFSLLDELRKAIRSAPFHEVLLVPGCNASVIQVPRLGVFGWSRNYLAIGLHLIDHVPPDEFRAILAHEFAHLSHEHGRFSRWIYRLRLSWEKTFQQLVAPAEQRVLSLRPVTRKFLEWYWPRFNAHAFVLSRTDEYEADAMAARVAGSQEIARALQRLALLHRQLNDSFWPEVWKQANTDPEPPRDLFQRIQATLRAGPGNEPDDALWLEKELRVPTTNADTHPCLNDRLRALHQPPTVARDPYWAGPQSNAAETFLGPALASIRTAVEQQWRKENEPHWRDRHARAAALNHRLSSIEQGGNSVGEDPDRLWDRARVLIDLHGREAALALLREVLTLRPDHAAANFHLGAALLEKEDTTAQAHLERAMNADAECVPAACQLLHDHFRLRGRPDKMREAEARLDQHERQVAASRAERSSVSVSDTLIPHSLAPQDLARLLELLSLMPQVQRADLARKELKHFPNQKLFLLCVRAQRNWYQWSVDEQESTLVNLLSQQVRLPGRILVFAPRGRFRALARKLRQVPDSNIYCAKPQP